MGGADSVDSDQFDRQKRIVGWDQEAVSKSRVLVVGAGALGNEVVKGLAQIGVERIALVDYDRIVKANLNRCVFFRPMDAAANLFKARVVSARVHSVNKRTKVSAVLKKVEELPEKFFDKFDCAFSCLDNLGARLHLNAQCYGKTPLIDGGTTGFFGKVQAVRAPSACLECAMSRQDYALLWMKYSCVGDPLDFVDPKMPALSTTNSVVAALQVNEFVKLAHSAEAAGADSSNPDSLISSNTLVGKYLFYDGLRNSQEIFSVGKREDCPVHQA
jgi:molybdopterin/thiamine biosynthesis adenylyltransferase